MFINNKQFMELYNASKNGNEKAMNIIAKYRQGGDKDSISRLIDDYYGIPQQVEAPTPQAEPVVTDDMSEQSVQLGNNVVTESENTDMVNDPNAEQRNIFDTLDCELEGCIDEPEVDDMTFDEFMEKKHRDMMRGKKNHDYFSAFDPEGRSQYSAMRKDRYGHTFDTRRRDIERSYNDMDNAIGTYIQYVSDQPDDAAKTDINVAGNAYDDIVSSVGKSHSFGRGWDNDDLNEVRTQLAELMKKYGRSNVLAALNILKGDNAAYRDFRNNAIDQAVKNYGGELDKLLK